MLVIGLTGNIGCGKSSLSQIFAQQNIKIIDADIIAREIYNDEKLIQLNKMTHPLIRQRVSDKIDEYKNQNKEMVILDAALLVESDYLNFIDKLLVVICNEDIQIERIKQRDNCSKEEALSRIKSQMSQEEKVKYADYIIDNSGTIEELRKKAFAFMDYIKEKCCE